MRNFLCCLAGVFDKQRERFDQDPKITKLIRTGRSGKKHTVPEIFEQHKNYSMIQKFTLLSSKKHNNTAKQFQLVSTPKFTEKTNMTNRNPTILSWWYLL